MPRDAITDILRSMSPEQERWAEALAVERQHGARGPAFIAERIGALALVGDVEGVERWRAIATKYDQLLTGGIATGGMPS